MKQSDWDDLCKLYAGRGATVTAVALTPASAVELANDVLGSGQAVTFLDGGGDPGATRVSVQAVTGGARVTHMLNKAHGNACEVTHGADADNVTMTWDGDGETRAATCYLPDRTAIAREKDKLLWACGCGAGGRPDLRSSPEDARAETERQILGHLNENGHDRRHGVYVGTFTAWYALTAPVSRVRVADGKSAPVDLDPPLPPELLWHEAGTGDGPDWCESWDGKLTARHD